MASYVNECLRWPERVAETTVLMRLSWPGVPLETLLAILLLCFPA